LRARHPGRGGAGLLPPLRSIREVSKVIALAVFKQAVADGVAMPIPEALMMEKINAEFWDPEYREYRRTSF
ncbi:MAG: NAD-dependent malic enzyme, partial [Sphingobacteriales bacterium]